MDPDALIVVATGRSPHGRPACATILGPPHHDRRAVDHVFVFGIDDDGRQVAATDPAQSPRIGGRGGGVAERRGRTGDPRAQGPVRTAVARLIEAHRTRPARGTHGRHHRINHLRIAGRDRDVRFEHRRQARELRPGRATVGGLVDPARPRPRRVGPKRGVFVKRRLLLPQRGVHGARVAGIDPHFVRARVLVLVQHLGERPPAVGRAIHAALDVRPIRMAECRDEETLGIRRTIGVGRIDVHIGNHLRLVEAQVRPRAAGVVGPVHAVAGREVGPDDPGTGTDVDHVGRRGRDGDGADGTGRFAVEQRHPVVAVVGRAPDAAVVEADVEDGRAAGRAGQRAGAAGPVGADRAPAECRGEVGSLRRRAGREQRENAEDDE